MRLYIINITLSAIQQHIQLMFNDEARGRAAKDLITNAMRGSTLSVEISDDYGRTVCVTPASIAAILFSDYATELSGRAEIQILEAHANIDLQKRAQQDQKLSNAQRILTPGNAQGSLFLGGRGN